METELEIGEFYTSILDGFDPVVFWIGRVDLASDLGGAAEEPVVSLMLQSPFPDAPIIFHGPFWEGIVLDCELQHADPFDVNEALFEEHYNIWRSAFDQGDALPWATSPNEVYAQMFADAQEEDEE